ncbi:MAG TPA: hypothetical protein VH600_20695 [Burkholderiales bacterium]
MRILVLLAFAAATPAWAQQRALPVDRMSQAQRADHRKLIRAYLDTFRILGRARLCGLAFDADPFFRQLALRHGENSEELRAAAISYKASAENLTVSPQVDPAPPAPIPCDVVALMGDMRLPALPASLVQRN